MDKNQDKILSSNEINSDSSSVDLDSLIDKIPDKTSKSQEEPVKTDKPQYEGYKTNSFFYYFLSVFGVVFISLFYLFQVYLQPIVVVGQSMLPEFNAQTLSNTDEEHCDIVYYREKNKYTHGDVIIISNEKDQYIDNTNNVKRVDFLIKRIIACPGDTITFFLTDVSENGLYYYYDISVVDKSGKQVELNEESYIKEPMYLTKNHIYTGLLDNIAKIILDDKLGIDNRKFSVTISDNCYFAMGDNRNNSHDSRSFGEVSVKDICGNVRIHVKYGENIWIALFNKIKSYLSVNYLTVKENL